MTQAEIKNWVIAWFVGHTAKTETELLSNSAENYFTLGYIDSFAFINLVADAEENFHIEFGNEAFEDRSFATIDGFCEMIAAAAESERK